MMMNDGFEEEGEEEEGEEEATGREECSEKRQISEAKNSLVSVCIPVVHLVRGWKSIDGKRDAIPEEFQ